MQFTPGCFASSAIFAKTGATALTSSCVINSTSLANTGLCLCAVGSSLWWLRAGRAATGTARYLPTHCVWHVWGALAVCAVTLHVQRPALAALLSGAP